MNELTGIDSVSILRQIKINWQKCADRLVNGYTILNAAHVRIREKKIEQNTAIVQLF